jgi:cellulose synthase/poly-beta-1,6-N-acetylglucosamine synthase-like glycosyltransferase
MNDLLYLAFNRLEFTRKSFETMLANTHWSAFDRLVIYDDGSTDGTREYLEDQAKKITAVETKLVVTQRQGPVGIMVDYLSHADQDGLFAKIDNDVMVPPGWFPESYALMKRDPMIDLLGIEAMYAIGSGPREFMPAEYIGGIGLMRRRAFAKCLPTPRGRFGFTAWQQDHPRVVKGWIKPALPICLLNLVPFEPWRSLSLEYIAKGWQRDWPGFMPAEFNAYWDWWK